MRISIGVIIAVILIAYWYMHDHPGAFSQGKQSYQISADIPV